MRGRCQPVAWEQSDLMDQDQAIFLSASSSLEDETWPWMILVGVPVVAKKKELRSRRPG